MVDLRVPKPSTTKGSFDVEEFQNLYIYSSYVEGWGSRVPIFIAIAFPNL